MARPISPRKRKKLPLPASEFIGRAAETAALLSAGQRLITLVGPPGTGKTRLALQAARQVAAGDPLCAVAWVPLASARSADDLARLSLAALDVAAVDDLEAANEALDRILDRGPALLVLDNFEQLVAVDGVLAWVGERLSQNEGLRVWVTSRERLRIDGERAFEVAPLGLPEAPLPRDSLVPPEPDAPESILGSDSVRLLLSRAPELEELVRGDLAQREALGEIARHLEGIPLALELAAARLVMMEPTELAERLRAHGVSRLDLLGRGGRELSTRQATLRGAIDWSWALLSAPERDLLAGLSLLRGVFEPSLAAEFGSALLSMSQASTLEWVQSLREKSLLSTPHPSKLAVPQSVRAFAEEKLSRGEEGWEPARASERRTLAMKTLILTLRTQAAALCAALNERGARMAFERLEALRDQLVHALELLETEREHLSVEDAVWADIALALDALRTRLGIARDLERALRELSERGQLPEETLGKITRALAYVLRDRGQSQEAVRVLEGAVARAHRDRPGAPELAMLVELGELLLSQGRFEEARAPIDEAIRGAEQRDERAILQRAQATSGLLAHSQGRLADAERHYTQALDGAQHLHDARAEAHALRDLGNVCLQRGEGARARAYYEDALAKSPGGDLRLEGVVRGNLAILLQEEGQLELAFSELRRALACLRAVGDRPFEAHLLGYLGAIQHERGQLDASRDAYARALTVLREVRDLRLEGVFSAARAAVLAQKGAFGHAHNDLTLAARRLDEVGDPGLSLALALHRASVAVCEGLSVGDARVALTEAAALLAQHAEAVKGNDDARFAARMLARLFPADALVVGPDGSYFERGGERTDLRARPTLARLLEALVERRLRGESAPLSSSDLLAAGWPGERVLPQAGQNRVRVALSSLRNLGLRSAIVTAEGGHLLDPTLPVARGS